MKREEFVEQLRYGLSLGTGGTWSGESLRVQPPVKWGLIDEYFEFWLGPFMGDWQLRLRYRDKVPLPESLRRWDHPVIIIRASTGDLQDDILIDKTSALSTDLLNDTLKFAFESLFSAARCAERVISPGAEAVLGDFNFLMSKWISRPSCVYLIRLLLHHFSESRHVVEAVAAGLGASDLVKNVSAATELL